ncbi:MAG: hypothetical protein QOH88_1655 [Verrucomicrobiota bacterium]|jgi:hypothetical protein
MITRPRAKAVKEENFYRCPGCGAMVDNRLRDAIRLHHDHVLHPRLDRFVTLPVVPSATAAAG